MICSIKTVCVVKTSLLVQLARGGEGLFQGGKVYTTVGARISNKFRRSGVSTRDSLSRPILKVCALSRGSILKSQNRAYTKHEYQPGSKMVEYQG